MGAREKILRLDIFPDELAVHDKINTATHLTGTTHAVSIVQNYSETSVVRSARFRESYDNVFLDVG